MAFSMDVIDVEKVKEEVAAEIKPLSEEEQAVVSQAKKNVDEILRLDLDSLEERRNMLQSVEQFGLDSLQRSSRKNTLLQVPVGQLASSGDEGSLVSRGLTDLQKEIKGLDPSAIDFTKRGILGKIFNPVRGYFERYQKADAVIEDILQSLEKGRVTLTADNTTLELEEQSLRDLTKKLNREAALGTAMDTYIEEQLEIKKADPANNDKVRFINEEILFPLRQRLMDIHQMIAVNQQGILAIEVIRRNNRELIRGVDRAKTVTVSALRTAVIVASALYNQQIVLKKIQALNQTTNDLIASTSKMLNTQGVEIQKQSMESTVSIDTLKQAYTDVISALDTISTYKQEALPRMKEQVLAFQSLAAQGEERIQRLEKGNSVGL